MSIILYMEEHEKFSWKKRARSFVYAWRGLGQLFREEHNSRIHLSAALLVVVAGFIVGLERWEWVAVVGCIGWVIMAEAFNSAVEAVADRFGGERHPLIAKAKDIAAGGVLVSAIAAAIIGMIIFLRKLTCWM